MLVWYARIGAAFTVMLGRCANDDGDGVVVSNQVGKAVLPGKFPLRNFLNLDCYPSRKLTLS